MAKGRIKKAGGSGSVAELDFNLGSVKEVDVHDLVPDIDEIEGYDNRLEAIEEAIGKKDIEYAVIINPEGNVVGCFEGDAHHVSLDASRLPGNVMTHNHPRKEKDVVGGPFTPADLESIAKGAIEIRAVSIQEGDKGVYSLKPSPTMAMERVSSLMNAVSRSEDVFYEEAQKAAKRSFALKVANELKAKGKWGLAEQAIDEYSRKNYSIILLGEEAKYVDPQERQKAMFDAIWEMYEGRAREKVFNDTKEALKNNPDYLNLSNEIEKAINEVEQEYRDKGYKTGERKTLYVSKKWQHEAFNRQMERMDNFYREYCQRIGFEYSSPFNKAA